MPIQYRITFTPKPQNPLLTKQTVTGRVLFGDDDLSSISVKDVTSRLVETEGHLERLTGMAVHIEQIG